MMAVEFKGNVPHLVWKARDSVLCLPVCAYEVILGTLDVVK